jgi:hypothetical protein
VIQRISRGSVDKKIFAKHSSHRLSLTSGDMLTFPNDVFDAANKTKVGGDQGFCIRITAGNAYECLWTLSIAAWQITVDGPFLDAGDSFLTVTGGTGKDADARGQMTLLARNAKNSEYEFNYALQHATTH